jgi:hypothetical protein
MKTVEELLLIEYKSELELITKTLIGLMEVLGANELKFEAKYTSATKIKINWEVKN